VPLRILLLGALFLPASVAADAGGEAPRCIDDAALTEAAGELLLSSSPLTTSTLTAAVREAGSDAVGVHALAYANAAEANAWLAKLAGRSDAALACGAAHGVERHLLLATARGGQLEPIDARKAVVRGALASGFDRAELVLAAGNGELQRFAVDAARLRAGVALSLDLRRPVRVQLLAHGKQGPRPVAERVLAAGSEGGAEPRDAAVSTTPGIETSSTPGASLEQQLDALRGQAARPSLRSNALLARAAQEHAGKVCKSGRVAHVLAPGDDPTHRLLAAGISARRVGETVARAASSEAALRSFMDSPSHRLTLLERSFTDVGVGQATDAAGKRCVVVLLAEWPRFTGR
jgi:uncharacterized protein YkwD